VLDLNKLSPWLGGSKNFRPTIKTIEYENKNNNVFFADSSELRQ